MKTLGNIDLLKTRKTAFLCSRKIPALVVLKCYDWAIAQREAGVCVISGFHSVMEKDVMHYLLKGKQPIIMALARELPAKQDPELQPHINTGRLLLVSPFEKEVGRVTEATAYTRNKLMLELADEVVIGYKHPDGNLSRILAEYEGVKKISYLQL